MIARRIFLAAATCIVSAPLASLAQPTRERIFKIGLLGPTSTAAVAKRLAALKEGLRELGYIEGKNLFINYQWAEGHYDRLPALAAELVHLKVDVIVTYSAPGTLAAMNATKTIPVVMMATGDAVASGLVTNLARPGGNITGLSFFTPELNTKRLELLKDVFPRMRRVAMLWNQTNVAGLQPAMDAAGAALKIEVQRFGISNPAELESVFAEINKHRIDAVTVYDDPMLIANVREIARLASKYQLPSIGFSEIADAGGLLAYGVDLAAMARRSAVYVDKVLKGAKPGDLPIERATTFELIINLKTARMLGVEIPQTVLVRADRVIK